LRDFIYLLQDIRSDSVNESFYDLLEQHFERITNCTGEVCLFANIAVGGNSRSRINLQMHTSRSCTIIVRSPCTFLESFWKV
jgi:hypothetical protein